MKYTVEIRETLSKSVEVESPNCAAALRLVEAQYNRSEIILGADDFVSVEVTVTGGGEECPRNPNFIV